MTFEYQNNTYSYIPYEELEMSMLPKRRDYKQSKYLDMGCGFDIETSRVPNEKLSFMYMWQFAIDEVTIIGRTWDEFVEFLDRISEHYQLDKKPMLCYIHNMSFEWQFIKRRLKWAKNKKGKSSVFALENREVIKATTTSGIEFRDSAILTQMSLSQMAKSFDLGIKKLDEEGFDYEKLRFSDTPLSDMELAYAINDVQILSRFYHKYIKNEFVRKHINISLTSTGIVRDELKRNFKKWNKKERVRYSRFVKLAYPDEKMYEAMITWLYRGGMTHANACLTDVLWENIGLSSYDIKSSYPASLAHELYPTDFVERPVEWFYKYGFNKAVTKKVAYFGTFVFKNIRAKSTFSLESENKIVEYSPDAIFDNGRLVKAKEITVLLNEIDMDLYDRIYEWDELICLTVYKSDKAPLPKFILDMVLKYFYLKESLPSGYERDIVKRKLNAIYGMMCTRLYKSNLEFDEETGMFVESKNTKNFEQLKADEILLPQFGIWCTSYSRSRLVKAMVSCDCHHNVYNDTDSCKILNDIGCTWVFKAHNDEMERINKTMYVGNYDRKYFKDMGKFECEYPKMFRFKTLGAKRYIYTIAVQDKETKLYSLKDFTTIAGMKKGSLQRYAKAHKIDIYDAFANELRLSEDESDKLTSVYEDAEWNRTIDGHDVSELSCVTLVKIAFSMKMTLEYIKLIEEFHVLNKRTYGRI